jgi:S1-C subfamily serine protease
MFKKILKSVLKVLVEVVLTLIMKKAQEKLEDINKPKKGNVKRLLIILIVGVTAICLTSWACLFGRQATLPSDIIIIRPLPVEDNPYQKEYDEMLFPTVMVETITGRGSGVVINRGGAEDAEKYTYILTAGHVVGKYSKVDVTFYDYNNTTFNTITASVVLTDTNKDLALLEIRDCFANTRNDKAARLAPRDYTYYLFAPVYVVGCSLGLAPRPSSGILSALGVSAVEITAPVLPGNSGGPVYSADTHELIGIAVWVHLYGDQLVTTMAGIVPINVIYEFLDSVSHRDTENTEIISSLCPLRLCGEYARIKYRKHLK